MHRDSGPATVSSAVVAAASGRGGVLGSGISNVANVDLHSDLSLEHGGCRGCSPLVVESEGQWRQHTMLKIGNLEQEEAIVTPLSASVAAVDGMVVVVVFILSLTTLLFY